MEFPRLVKKDIVSSDELIVKDETKIMKQNLCFETKIKIKRKKGNPSV